MRKACIRCGKASGCTCRPPIQRGERGAGPERTAQARFRSLVLARDQHRCVDCGSGLDLRACHLTPRHMDGTYDPANGVTRCRACDLQTDTYAR